MTCGRSLDASVKIYTQPYGGTFDVSAKSGRGSPSVKTPIHASSTRRTVRSVWDPRPFSETRSSAQGNCSAKSLASNVVDSSLSSLSSQQGGVQAGEGDPTGGGGSSGGGGLGRGRGGGGEGKGRGRGRGWGGGGDRGISSTLPYILHCHMVLRPEGTSHNHAVWFGFATNVHSETGRNELAVKLNRSGALECTQRCHVCRTAGAGTDAPRCVVECTPSDTWTDAPRCGAPTQRHMD